MVNDLKIHILRFSVRRHDTNERYSTENQEINRHHESITALNNKRLNTYILVMRIRRMTYEEKECAIVFSDKEIILGSFWIACIL